MHDSRSPFHADLTDALKDMSPAGSSSLTEAQVARVRQVTTWARDNLLEQVMPFWESRVIDPQHAGLLHYFDREGRPTETSKSTWGQGRMAYTFSLLYLEADDVEAPRREQWLNAADSAIRFLVEHAHAGHGRWHYLCDREGSVLDQRGSAFSDTFALMGLCAHALATRSDRNHALIQEALAVLVDNLQSPTFAEYHHFNLDPSYRWHAPAMAAMGLTPLARAVVGDEAIQPLSEWALREILWRFANDEHEMLLEMTDPQGRLVETDAGRTTNPGHALESMWFCFEEALHRRDPRSVQRCLQITKWAWEKGWDREHGGLFAFVTPEGGPPSGERSEEWQQKLWWVQSESMYCLALASVLSDDPFYFDCLEKLHQWTSTHLPDREHGEWFMATTREGRPHLTTKGNVFRSAFHVPRSLLKLARLGDAIRLDHVPVCTGRLPSDPARPAMTHKPRNDRQSVVARIRCMR